MMNNKLKKYETIACCGIDCGLCPRFYTKGSSVCPGCGGLDFKEVHPSCGVLTCCAVKKGFEVCSECSDYPCKRFSSYSAGCDSFVTHKKMFENLEYIKNNGIEQFLENQKERMNILSDFLSNFDDGRSKSFYCLSCTLLPLDKLMKASEFAQKIDNIELKKKNKRLKEHLTKIADELNIEMKLNKRKVNDKAESLNVNSVGQRPTERNEHEKPEAPKGRNQ